METTKRVRGTRKPFITEQKPFITDPVQNLAAVLANPEGRNLKAIVAGIILSVIFYTVGKWGQL